MHELAIAQSLLNIVLEEAQRHGVRKVTRVGVKVGAFSSVVPDSLSFCFDLIKEGSVAAQAALVVLPVPLAGQCPDCGQRVELPDPFAACPVCGGLRVGLDQGQELLVDFIESDDSESE